MGYLTYGSNVNNNIILSLTGKSTIKLSAQALMAGHLFFAFLIVANPVNQEIEELLGIPKGILYLNMIFL